MYPGCDLKDSASGVAANTALTVMNAMGDACDTVGAEMAEWEAFQTELYEFQFDFVDSFAAAVKGNEA